MTERTNPITPAGFAAMQAEYHQLMSIDRPAIVDVVSWAAGNGDRSETATIYMVGKSCGISTAAQVFSRVG